MPDSDGYPIEGELEQIRKWDGQDPSGWFAFIRSCWWAADWGWTEFEGTDDLKRWQRIYLISTGGWSGNESIISAMQKNFVLWALSWHQHRRGGHWEFRVSRA